MRYEQRLLVIVIYKSFDSTGEKIYWGGKLKLPNSIHVRSAWSNRAIFEVQTNTANMVNSLLRAVIENILGIALLTDQAVAGHYLQNPFKSQTYYHSTKTLFFGTVAMQ